MSGRVPVLAASQPGEMKGRSYDRVPAVTSFRAHNSQWLAAVKGLPQALVRVASDTLMAAFSGDQLHRRDGYAVIAVMKTRAVERLFVNRLATTAAPVRQALAASCAEDRSSGCGVKDLILMPVAIQMVAG